jgi:hypothetical protein
MQHNADSNVSTDNIGFLPDKEWNIFLYSGILINIKTVLPRPGLDGK